MADQRFIDTTSLKVAVTRYCEVKARTKRRKAFKECVSELCRDICLAIDAEPSADVRENVKGVWIHRKEMDYVDRLKVKHIHGMCNKCGFVHDFIDGHTSQYGFCPNCGADMRGEHNDKQGVAK